VQPARDLSKWIARLKDGRPSTRYEACEELRVAAHLPPEALEALRLATQDSDASVAESARSALAVHNPDGRLADEPAPPVQRPAGLSVLGVLGKHALSILAGILTSIAAYGFTLVIFATSYLDNDPISTLSWGLIGQLAVFLIPVAAVVWWMYRANGRRFTALYFATAAPPTALAALAMLGGRQAVGPDYPLGVVLFPTALTLAFVTLAALSHRIWPPHCASPTA